MRFDCVGREENQAVGGVDHRRQPNGLRQRKIARRVARRQIDQQQTLVFRQQQQPLARPHRLGNDRLPDDQSPEELARRALDAEQFLVHGIAQHDVAARRAGDRQRRDGRGVCVLTAFRVGWPQPGSRATKRRHKVLPVAASSP